MDGWMDGWIDRVDVYFCKLNLVCIKTCCTDFCRSDK